MVFKPELCTGTRNIINTTPELQVDFLTRQPMLNQKAVERREKKLLHEMAMDPSRAPCTFVPHIGNANRILQHTRSSRLSETDQARLERMTKHEPLAKQVKATQRTGEYYAQFTYEPQLNEFSRMIGQATPLHELVHNEKRKKARAVAALAVQAAEQEQCSFAPKLRKSSASNRRIPVSDASTILSQIEEKRREKMDQIEEGQRNKEYEELKECTFAPQTNTRRRRKKKEGTLPSQRVVVRGLGRFLELKALKRKQESEQKERESKQFDRHTSYTPRSHTVPEPFHLSYQNLNLAARRKVLKQSVQDEEMKECTFSPQTMETVNRKLIEDVLMYSETL